MPVCFAVSLNRRAHDSDFLGTRTLLSHPRTDDTIHWDQIEAWGGLHGLRSDDALESAIAQPKNVYLYGGGDLYEIAAAYAFHIAESQAYLDGNKRTAFISTVTFLSINGYEFVPGAETEAIPFVLSLYDNHEFRFEKLVPWLQKHVKPSV